MSGTGFLVEIPVGEAMGLAVVLNTASTCRDVVPNSLKSKE